MEKALARLLQDRGASNKLVYFEEIGSTNTCAMELGAKDAPHGTLVVSDQQLSGKGRRGRNWVSPPGTNIYMSLLLRPDFETAKAPMLTLVMAYSVAEALQKKGIFPQIKWPNDLILNKKKICGILTEMAMKEQKIDYIVIGVGINVGNREFPEELRISATSLVNELGITISREELIVDILEKFEYNYEKFCETEDLQYLVEAYNKILVNLGEEVRIIGTGGEYRARSGGINQLGELYVEKMDGTSEWIYAGEVSVRGVYGYV